MNNMQHSGKQGERETMHDMKTAEAERLHMLLNRANMFAVCQLWHNIHYERIRRTAQKTPRVGRVKNTIVTDLRGYRIA